MIAIGRKPAVGSIFVCNFNYLLLMAGELGFEPRYSESESDVLPLDDSPADSRSEATSEAISQ